MEGKILSFMRIPLPVLSVSFNSPLLPGTEKGTSVPGTLFLPFPGTENPSSVPGSRIPPERDVYLLNG